MLDQPAGQDFGLVEPPLSFFPGVKGNREDRVDSVPEVCGGQVPGQEVPQKVTEDFKPSVLEQENNILEVTLIPT